MSVILLEEINSLLPFEVRISPCHYESRSWLAWLKTLGEPVKIGYSSGNIDSRNNRWTIFFQDSPMGEVRFRDAKDAVEFKLRFG